MYRLRFATGTLTAPGDFEDYTERAILAGQPDEAKLVIQTGFEKNVLNDQTDSGHAGRLKTLAEKAPQNATPTQSSSDPLATGIAFYSAGENSRAIAQLQTIPGYDAASGYTARLARLWVIYLRHQPAAQAKLP